MRTIFSNHALAGLFGAALVLTIAGQAHAADATAAQELARRSNCFKCHAIDKQKEAIAWNKVPAKFKGKPDAEATLIKHITTGPKVKLEDGSEETHPIVKTKNADEIKNLVGWILSL